MSTKKNINNKKTEKQPIESITKKEERSFYEILGVQRTATESEIKKAYYKLAREVHPDKNNSADAKEEFQKLGRIYSILKDEGSRKFYDKHGDVERDEFALTGKDLYEAWLKQYDIVRLSEDRINDFFKQQEIQKKSSGKNVSKDEENDLIDFYNKNKGDMKKIKEYVIGCETKKDIQRMCDHLKELVDEGKLKSYPIFLKSGLFSTGDSSKSTTKTTTTTTTKGKGKKQQIVEEEEEEEEEEEGEDIGDEDDDEDDDESYDEEEMDDEEDDDDEEEIIDEDQLNKKSNNNTKKVGKSPTSQQKKSNYFSKQLNNQKKRK